jgi:hypothetical protein
MLQHFQMALENLTGNPTDLRPFVCEGSPLNCQIFIVGFNPATELKRSFWDFWQPDYGFQKAAWLELYKQERRGKPLSPGKTRRAEVSNTRRVIEWIVAEAKPVKCLETNLYAKATIQASDLKEQERITRPFDFLLKTIRPVAILLHGKDAARHIETTFGTSLETNKMQPVQVEWGTLQVIAVPHLSRGWSERRAREVGQVLREASQV